ncbi:MAG: AHH domain-containing protein [Parasphingorhabdus sp.]
MIPFSQINRPNDANHRPNYQRHHLIPRQAGSEAGLQNVFHDSQDSGFNLEDFEINGILLPSCENEALRTGWPLHRGPHPRYNEIVIERLVHISKLGDRIDKSVERQSFIQFRLFLLLSSLHSGLNKQRFKKISLNHRDPLRSNQKFDLIDSRIEQLRSRIPGEPMKRACFTLKDFENRKYISEL